MEKALSVSVLLPELVLITAACAALLMGVAKSPSLRRGIPWLALIAIIAGMLLIPFGPARTPTDHAGITLVGGGLDYRASEITGATADFMRISALVLGLLIVLASWTQPRESERGEFFSMLLMSLSGLMLVGAADNLLVLFLALELVSIPAYVLVTLSRLNPRALEAGTKYFYLGAMSAAINAYGFSFLFGVSGTASISGSIEAVQDALHGDPYSLPYGLALVGVGLSIAGLLFKIAAVPLHLYVADVYHGAASAVAGMLGFVPKAAGFVAIFRVLQLTNLWTSDDRSIFFMLWIVAVFSMTVGNVLALMQTNIKRMLAYSGVAHAGYMLVGLIAGPRAGNGMFVDGAAAVLYYLIVYGIANLGAFTILGMLRVRGEPCETVRDVAGLLRRHPGLAMLMALAMFTLLGLPPLPGFWGKMGLFGGALAAGETSGLQYWYIVLVIIAVVNTAIGAAYYLRVVAAVLLYDNDEPAESTSREAPLMGALLCGFLLLIFAFVPATLLRPAQIATRGAIVAAPAGHSSPAIPVASPAPAAR